MAKSTDKLRQKLAIKKIAEIQSYLDSGMCPPKDIEHFKERVNKLMPEAYGTRKGA